MNLKMTVNGFLSSVINGEQKTLKINIVAVQFPVFTIPLETQIKRDPYVWPSSNKL